MTAVGGQPFRVLMVCTANRYRSPLAEFLMKQRIGEIGLNWVVGSAGTAAQAGRDLDRNVAAILTKRSVALAAWRSRRLTVEEISSADLILTAEHAHRRAVVLLCPAAVHRTFLLCQMARLVSASDAAGESASGGLGLIDAAVAARGHLQPVPEHVDELADPARRSPRTLRQCADRIERAITSIAQHPRLVGTTANL